MAQTIEMAPALGKCENTTWINSQDFSLKKKTLFQLSFKFERKNVKILGVVKWSQKSCRGDGYVVRSSVYASMVCAHTKTDLGTDLEVCA